MHIVLGGSFGDRDAKRAGQGYLGNFGKVLPVQAAESLDGGCGYDVVQKVGHNRQEKDWRCVGLAQLQYSQRYNRLYSNILQQMTGQALRSCRGPQYGHVPGRQAHEVFMLKRMVEQTTD